MLHRLPARHRNRATKRERWRLSKRAYRTRLAAGGASLKGVPVTDVNALTEALMDLHWLDEAKSEDRKALAAAVGALLDDIAKPYRRRVLNGQTEG
jgi:hypothetical protein